MTRRLSSRSARASSSGGSAPARTKPPSRLTSGRSSASVDARSRSSAPQSRLERGEGARELRRQVVRRLRACARQRAAAARPSRTDARSRGPPRSRLRRDSERRKSGAPRERLRAALRAGARLDEKVERIEPLVDRIRVGQRAREPLGEQPRAGGRHGEVDRREQRAFARAARASGSSSRLARVAAIDLEARAARAPRRRRERRPRLELGAPDIGERERRGGDLGAGEGAEAVERLDAIELAHALLGRRRRRRPPAQAASAPRACRRRCARKPGSSATRLRGDDLARLEPRDLGGEAGLVGLAERKRAGREIERRETVGPARFVRRGPAGPRREAARGRARAAAPR